MFGFFKSASFVDPELGELHRSRGAWRGTLKLDTETSVPLVLGGGRAAPDPEALRIARPPVGLRVLATRNRTGVV